MDGEETLLVSEPDSGSYAVTVTGLDGDAPTVQVAWTCFAPSDDLVLAVLDRLHRVPALDGPGPSTAELLKMPLAAAAARSGR